MEEGLGGLTKQIWRILKIGHTYTGKRGNFVKCLVVLLCVLTLTGCTSILEREYSSFTHHMEYPVSKDSSILQAENYQGLVSALIYFIVEHDKTGVIHLSNYLGDVGADLEIACAEVLEKDPLGAYALNGIEYKHTRIVSYYEVTITFDYAHTQEEVAAIIPATGSQAIFQAVSSAMAGFDKDCVLRLSYFTGDENTLLTQARQAWLDTPLAALTAPDIGVKLYPDSGTSRVAEFTFEWPEEATELSVRSTQLETVALQFLQKLDIHPGGVTVEVLLDALIQWVEIGSEGGGSAYDALVDGRANSQGMALALRLLCQLADLEATVVEGEFNGEPRFWLIVSTDEGYRHLDPSVQEPLYATDSVFQGLGYLWSVDRYPDCTDYAAAGSTGEIGVS